MQSVLIVCYQSRRMHVFLKMVLNKGEGPTLFRSSVFSYWMLELTFPFDISCVLPKSILVSK